MQGAHTEQRRVSVQRWSRLNSGGDVSGLLLIRARRRVPVPSCNAVAGRARDVADYIYDAGGSNAVDRSGSWWGPKDVEFVIQDPVYLVQ